LSGPIPVSLGEGVLDSDIRVVGNNQLRHREIRHLIDIDAENRSRITNGLDELQRLQVVRELFPDDGEAEVEDPGVEAEAAED